ncbi:hypothetical protein [Spongiimicrobium salis]|uniref:hypothetical protein n=1 Tax=Spongiimicrobium salis TaxID=1667022 RepID=UPI00374DDF8C
MKKFENLGRVLNKAEQKALIGGGSTNNRGVCSFFNGQSYQIYYECCDRLCDDGTNPVCGFGDDPGEGFCAANPSAPGCNPGF